MYLLQGPLQAFTFIKHEALQQDNYLPGVDQHVFADLSCISPVGDTEPTCIEFPPELPAGSLVNSEDTETLLRDLECILPDVAGTPPQSPPPEDFENRTMYTDIDELIFLRSLSLPDPVDNNTTLYLPPTPNSTPSYLSPAHSPYASPPMTSPAPSVSLPPPSPSYMADSSPYPASTSTGEEDSDSNTTDPDWTMDDAPGPSRKQKTKNTLRVTKPYARVKQPQDRKERKKLQNKNAATRYRLKKKAEEDDLLSEETVLEERNQDLQAQVDDLSNEVRIIKGLLRDQCRRLGLIPK